jgi:ABC-type transporter Mla maintaining outer membrane lipid asymmetry ATPase subunit MlaF
MSEFSRTAIIEMRDATVAAMRDDSLTMVESVNWSVLPGQFWVIGGQQRSGKSDLLMLAGGLMAPGAGDCRLFGCDTFSLGEDQLAQRLRAGFVFQGGRLFERMTVAENVALPLRYHKNLSLADTAAVVEQVLELLELAPFADVTPANLATNWRSRVALARSLILKPELLLLDNPFSGLAVRHRQWLLRFLDQLWRGHVWLEGRPMTLVVTTDDLRPWQAPGRQFALLHEKTFVPLGSGQDLVNHRHPALRELLAETLESNH